MNIITIVKDKINQLNKSFIDNPLLYFNESDLQSELFRLLCEALPQEEQIKNISYWGTKNPPPTKEILTRKIELSIRDIHF